MRKTVQLLVIGSILLLSGCTYATDTMSQPPVINWDMPESIDPKAHIDMIISLQGEHQSDLKMISLVLKKQGETNQQEIPFEQDDQGSIKIHTSFDEEGIYTLQAKIETANQIIQPTCQIVVGKVIQGDGKKDESNKDAHDSHH